MDGWRQRIDATWNDTSGTMADDELIARIDAIAAERGDDDAEAVFERAGARDSAGRPDEAVPLYERALALGLDDELRPQAIVQMASSIRNLGDVPRALELLEDEMREHPEAPFRDEVAAFIALTLASSGDARRAASVALLALAPHLRRYTRSVTNYARELLD
ncbi:tetratricopeptide repeat protein [Agromyces sp. M3QZ16-3]|uniref:tetratricopeptide repeat protein n=1 Tax=Agromyces sp. M3QZ16-3 TaxID=3447585 RepID=UPI003F6903E9